MKITRDTAMQLWIRHYGFSAYAEDFDGGLMYRDAYGNPDYRNQAERASTAFRP